VEERGNLASLPQSSLKLSNSVFVMILALTYVDVSGSCGRYPPPG
jgi:hypothetical protein